VFGKGRNQSAFESPEEVGIGGGVGFEEVACWKGNLKLGKKVVFDGIRIGMKETSKLTTVFAE
jgi:hypothetical protein